MSFMNRLGNAKNPYQTDARRVLAVCSAGLLRSPTVANVLHQHYGYNTRAAGISSEYALIPMDDVLFSWAQEIVFVSDDVHQDAARIYGTELEGVKVVTLDLPDRFEWNDPELRELIISQYTRVNSHV